MRRSSLRSLGILCLAAWLAGACGEIVVAEAADTSGVDAGPITCSTDDDCIADECLTGTCDSAAGICEFAPKPGHCFIDGECYANGDRMGGSLCQVCDPAQAQNGWSTKNCPEFQACSEDTGECVPQGSFGTPCTSDEICASGPCVGSPNGSVCSQECVDECPEGWVCADYEDGKVCLHPHTNLCRPCSSDAECREFAPDTGAYCVLLGEAGSFCGVTCVDDGDCPVGYGCSDVELPDGEAKQCTPTSGACGCSQWATEVEATTACGVGECVGSSHCASDGSLTACDADMTGSTDVCDALDNDCDGATDEDFMQDGKYIHADHCGECDQPCTIDNATAECQLVDEAPACVLISCNPGYEQQNNACVAVGDKPCAPCTLQEDCLAGLACTKLLVGSFCLPACDLANDECGDGLTCTDLGADGTFCTLDSGGCAAQGSVCTYNIHCDDMNPCTSGLCDGILCTFEPDDNYSEACYEGPEGTEDVGACIGGTRYCSGGSFGPCEGQVVPVQEICGNTANDDCDDETNEECTIVGVDLVDGGNLFSGVTDGLTPYSVDIELTGGVVGTPTPTTGYDYLVDWGLLPVPMTENP